MSTPASSPIPKGFHTLTPYLVCKDASSAITFYKSAFGATENFRLPGPDGSIVHACLTIGDSSLMISDECPEMGALAPQGEGSSPVTIHLSVTDADGVAARAAASGAKIVMPVADMFWGARYGVLRDPFGHSWSVATQVRDMSPQEIEAAMREQMCGAVAQSA
jgi:uncharacterized glyoxalase superfamily protein PhnB